MTWVDEAFRAPGSRRLLIETAQDNAIRVSAGQRSARCILITEGLGNLRDRNLYLSDAVESAVAVFEGAQCYLDHPSSIDEESRPERSVRDLVGWFSDCAVTSVRDANTGDRLRACVGTLHFSEAEPGEIAYQQVKAALAYRKAYPDSKSVFCGLSINAGGLSEEAEIDGLGRVNAVHEISDVFSCDLVTKPARGGTFLTLSESFKSPVRVKEGEPVWLRRSMEHFYRSGVVARDDTFLGFARGTMVESDAEAVLADMVAKVESLMDQADDAEPDADLDDIPLDSVMDDLEHKKSVRRSMQPDAEAEVGDAKFPEPVDAWQTAEGEEDEGERGQRRPSQGRSRHESAAVKHFASSYEESGAGDGMAGADSTRTTPEIGEPDEDGKLDKSASEVNYKYALDPERSCGKCVHLQRGDDGTLGCELVKGMVRLVDSCNLFDPADGPEQAFHDAYDDE